jgi:hypothetical protein
MGTISPQELLKKWQIEEITIEMAIGHLIQNVVKLYKTIEKLTNSLYNLRADVDSLIAHTGMPPNPKGKRKPPKKS